MSILVWRDYSSGTRTNDEVTATHKHAHDYMYHIISFHFLLNNICFLIMRT